MKTVFYKTPIAIGSIIIIVCIITSLEYKRYQISHVNRTPSNITIKGKLAQDVEGWYISYLDIKAKSVTTIRLKFENGSYNDIKYICRDSEVIELFDVQVSKCSTWVLAELSGREYKKGNSSVGVDTYRSVFRVKPLGD